MNLYQIDPTKDVRWADLVNRHPRASVFHTSAWLQALRHTYGYEPVVFTTSPPTTELQNGLVFCRVKSWLTGRRLISLPFSDHCEPLCDASKDLTFIVRYLQTSVERERWKYLEVRGASYNPGETGEINVDTSSPIDLSHVIDLSAPINDIFQRLDGDRVSQNIERADGGGLIEKTGRSDDLLRDFYDLFVATRRRHREPPIPYTWFRNLIRCQGEAVEIRMAYERTTPISAIVTLHFKDTVYYKYECADSQFNRLGATQWILCRAISAAKAHGATKFDMGRSEENYTGLLAFKSQSVPQPKRISYWTYPDQRSRPSTTAWKWIVGNRLFSYMPSRLLTLTGRLVYRHIA